MTETRSPVFLKSHKKWLSFKYCLLFHPLLLKRFIPGLCGFWQRYKGMFQKQISKAREQLDTKMISQPEVVPLLNGVFGNRAEEVFLLLIMIRGLSEAFGE